MKKEILLTKEEIEKINIRLGEEISRDYEGKDLVVICLLKGGVMFATDLIKHIESKVFLDYLTVSSYKDEEESSGNVEIKSDISIDIKGKDVLIVDDIFDTGYTMKNIYNYLNTKSPRSLKTCVLLDKPERREVDFSVDYIGKEIDNLFVVGYGLDYEGFYRNIPYIFIFK